MSHVRSAEKDSLSYLLTRHASRTCMPRRNDIHSILLIGSGPIVIGQACELDCSRTQAYRTLLEEDYRVMLINPRSDSNTLCQPSIGQPRLG